MSETHPTLIIAADSEQVRAMLCRLAAETGWVPVVLSSSYAVRGLRDVPRLSLVMIEAGDDAAGLTQAVYEIYRKLLSPTPWIVGLLSESAIRRNPRAAAWDIDGHAALLALVPLDDPGVETGLRALLGRLKAVARDSRPGTAE